MGVLLPCNVVVPDASDTVVIGTTDPGLMVDASRIG
ncbi:MAG: hypothetical protein ACLP4W_07345 [Mycobacterium sp.]